MGADSGSGVSSDCARHVIHGLEPPSVQVLVRENPVRSNESDSVTFHTGQQCGLTGHVHPEVTSDIFADVYNVGAVQRVSADGEGGSVNDWFSTTKNTTARIAPAATSTAAMIPMVLSSCLTMER